jgi:hypothetical protein
MTAEEPCLLGRSFFSRAALRNDAAGPEMPC